MVSESKSMKYAIILIGMAVLSSVMSAQLHAMVRAYEADELEQ